MLPNLETRLQSLGLLNSELPAASAPDAQVACQLAQQARRGDLANALRADWPGFLETWTSSTLQEASRQATEAERVQVAQAWAECLPEGFAQAIRTLGAKSPAELLLPWVQAASQRRHARLPLAPGALLEEWCAVIDPQDPEDERHFWSRVSEKLRTNDAKSDRQKAAEVVADLAKQLANNANEHLPRIKGGAKTLMFWRNSPAHWLEELIADRVFMNDSTRSIVQHTQAWKGQLDPDQAFPALAMGLETALTRSLGCAQGEQVQALEKWLASTIEQALPSVIQDPLATPQVARLVRESLHLDEHAQALVPPPILRPA